MHPEVLELIFVILFAIVLIVGIAFESKFKANGEGAARADDEMTALQKGAQSEYRIKLLKRDIAKLMTQGGMLILDDKSGIVYETKLKRLTAIDRVSGVPMTWSPLLSKQREMGALGV